MTLNLPTTLTLTSLYWTEHTPIFNKKFVYKRQSLSAPSYWRCSILWKYTHQSVWGSSIISKFLHLSLLYAGFWEKIPFPIAAAAFVVFDGELGALGDGPFLKLSIFNGDSSLSLNSPCKSPELNLLRRKFIPVWKLAWKFENEILAAVVWWLGHAAGRWKVLIYL